MAFISPASIPQGMQTGYASRLRLDQTTLFVSTQPMARRTRASAGMLNYADFDDSMDDDDDDASFGASAAASDAARQPERKTEIKKPAAPTRHALYSDEQLRALADEEEVLVPLRLTLDYENYKITDFFMWNLREPALTPEQFAIITCQDLDLPVGYTSTIANAIKSQIQDYQDLANIRLPDAAGFHVLVHLTVNLDKRLYEDKFEWDMGSDLTPEEFAQIVVADMGISGEFYPAIAHALHEAVLRLKREMIEGHLQPDVDSQAAFGAPAGLRTEQDSIDEWTPTIELLSQEEIERREMERERMIRRMKRESARLGTEIDMRSLMGRYKRPRRTDTGSPW